MSTELLVPFGLDSNGHPAVTQSPDIQAMQHVKSVVATNPGERVMLPDYGVPVRGYLFQPDPELITLKINRDVTIQLARWEPAISVLGIRASPDSDFGLAEIEVDFTANPVETNAVQTATVEVGGTVIESLQQQVTGS